MKVYFKTYILKSFLLLTIIMSSCAPSSKEPVFESSSYLQLEKFLKMKINNNSLPVVFAIKDYDSRVIYHFMLNENINYFSLYYSASKATHNSNRIWNKMCDYPRKNMKKDLGKEALLKLCIQTIHDWITVLEKVRRTTKPTE